MERSVRQVDKRQHYNQQHDEDHAAEDVEHRRLDVPLRHVPSVLPEFQPEVNPLNEPLAAELPLFSTFGLLYKLKGFVYNAESVGAGSPRAFPCT